MTFYLYHAYIMKAVFAILKRRGKFVTNNTLQLTATNIRYLIAIHKLGGAEKFVKCTDIAKNLSVTRPSVHAMVKTLSEMNLIEKPHYGKVNFTHYGKETAQIYIDSYDTVCSYGPYR